MEAVISALIAGGLSLVGVIITNISGNKKIENKLVTAQAVTDTKIDMLTEEVKKHNNFAARMPVVEEQIRTMQGNMTRMDSRIRELEQAD